ncbi:MAG: pyridoxal-phosphate dependent enzyme [Dactylosporangium sp.]|nr:pyridoxal-phosphate dependent enzyme [Dactylosporangium sp.]NNJ63612.1 pyridoxal-phosphate dependent enzyme [Dactylosporangium sp.]
MRYDSVLDLIGDTPLVRIDPRVHGVADTELYAKLEMCNPFGSVKDRTAWNMASPEIRSAAARGHQVVELSSGNTAKALAIIAAVHGTTFKSVTNRMRIPEVRDMLLLLGAEIEELPGQSECLDPAETEEPLARFHRALVESGTGYLHTDQYFNPRNAQAHIDGTGEEIVRDLDGRCPDLFAACVGTAGSSAGVATVLRRVDPGVEVLGLVADKSDFIPGIRTIDEVSEVGLFRPETYHRIESVTAAEAIDGMVTLIRRCGILGGPTAGAAYVGAVRRLRALAKRSPARRTGVFIVCDRVEGYLGYIRQRRPDLFGRPPTAASVETVTTADLAGARTLDVGAARSWITAAGPLVVDLRGSFAFAAGHIPGSVNLPEEIFADLVRGGMPFGSERPVLLACPVGERSARYSALLTRLGHPDIRSLDGGIVAWRDAGAPLARGSR